MSISTNKTYVRWTKEDKLQLLRGLKTFGHRDVRNIAKLLPNKSHGAVRTMIYKYSIMAKELDKRDNPMDDWLQSNIFSDCETMIPQALLYIYLFEDHPPPNETGDCNVSTLYDLFYRASMNYSPPEMSQKNIDALRALHESVEKNTMQSTEAEVIEYINSIYNPEHCTKTYSNPKKPSEEKL